MPSAIQIDGDWPAGVELRKGWGRANARPWNPLTKAGAVRLLRGTASFLIDVRDWVAEIAGGAVLSPALYQSGTKVWERAGFDDFLELEIMEKAIELLEDDGTTQISHAPDLAELEALDRVAFDPFWHMGKEGMREALAATPSSAVLEIRDGADLAGYALVGAQLGISFLQRIAVPPTHVGRGHGTSLIGAAQRWASGAGASTMVLNVRPDNDRAIALYARTGFTRAKGRLHVLRYQPNNDAGPDT